MTDKNDAKLKLEDMNEIKKDQYKLSIGPLSTPYRAVFEDLSYDDFKLKFDKYWDENKVNIINKFKAKIRNKKSKLQRQVVENTIGIKKLYTDIFIDWINDKIDNILFIEELSIFGFENKLNGERKPIIMIVFYYTPEITIDKDIDFKLKNNRKGISEEKQLDNYLNITLMNKYRIETNHKGDIIDDCCKVQVDIISKVDGDLVEGLTKYKEWIDLTNFPNIKLREEIINHKKNDIFDVEWETSNNKLVKAQITIHDIKSIKFPDIDDALARREGFNDLELLKENFLKDYRKIIKNNNEELAKGHIINQVFREYEIPPFPERWLQILAKDSMNAFIKDNNKNLKAVMQSVGAKDKDELLKMFKSQIHRDFVQKMIIRAYIKKFNLENDEKNFLQHVMNNIEWIE